VLTTELTLTTLPPWGPKCLTASWVARSRPRTFRSKSLWKCSGGDLRQRGELVGAGVVDEDVDPAERLLRLGEQAADVGRPGHVGLHREGPAALARDLGDDPVGPLLAGGVVDDDGRALGGQLLCDGGADPLGRAGDNRDLSRESLRHAKLLWGLDQRALWPDFCTTR
jgi:hypothetical protein